MRLVNFFYRLNDGLLIIFATAVLTLAVNLFAPSETLTDTLIQSVVSVSILGFVHLASSSARTLAWACTHRWLMLLGHVTVATLLTGWLVYDAPESGRSLTLGFGFLILGVVLGVLVREFGGQLLLFAVFRRKRLGTAIRTVAIWHVIVIIYPWDDHGGAAPWYVAGIGLGCLLHKGTRLWWERVAAAYRRLLNIADAWPPHARATEAELKAIGFLRKGQIKRLKAALKRWKANSEWTIKLALIDASVSRLQGRHQDSVQATAPAPDVPTESVHAHLLVLRALGLAELGQEEEAQRLIQDLAETDFGKRCPAVNATLSMRLSEIALEDLTDAQLTRVPLGYANEALEQRRKVMAERWKECVNNAKTIDGFLARFLDLGIPATASFMSDVLAYALLAAGFAGEAKIYLEHCITLDPTYSNAYLHLGDYFSVLKSTGRKSKQQSASWHAEACYRIARSMERRLKGRIYTQANSRL